MHELHFILKKKGHKPLQNIYHNKYKNYFNTMI